jgi:hypothetical protein
LANGFTSTLDNIQSTVIQELLKSGIRNNEIINDNDYLVQQEGENVLYQDNTVHAVFNEIYTPMRESGGRSVGINIHKEDVYVNHKPTTVYVVTLGNGLFTLAQGREENMTRLNDKLNQLVGNDSIKNLVRKSYKEARLECRADENKTLIVLEGFPWIPRSFVADVRRSRRDELTS